MATLTERADLVLGHENVPLLARYLIRDLLAEVERITKTEREAVQDLAKALNENAKLREHAEAMACQLENMNKSHGYTWAELRAYRAAFPKEKPDGE